MYTGCIVIYVCVVHTAVYTGCIVIYVCVVHTAVYTGCIVIYVCVARESIPSPSQHGLLPSYLAVVTNIASLVLGYDMRRLNDITAFRRYWYHTSLVEALFIGSKKTQQNPPTTEEEREEGEGASAGQHLSLTPPSPRVASSSALTHSLIHSLPLSLLSYLSYRSFHKHPYGQLHIGSHCSCCDSR